MSKEDDDDLVTGMNISRFPCMPSLVALQQMRNRLHMAYVGKKLMKWTAQATGRELRKIARAYALNCQPYYDEVRDAYILLARARYFFPNLNNLVKEHIAKKAEVTIDVKIKSITGVKVLRLEIVESGEDGYSHLGIGNGGDAVTRAKIAWKLVLMRVIRILEGRTSFKQVEDANKSATKKKNVLEKVIIPRNKRTIKFILDELEELEREDIYRLKMFRKLKARRSKKGTHTCCNCDSLFVPEEKIEPECFVCKKRFKIVSGKDDEINIFTNHIMSHIDDIIALTQELKLDETVKGGIEQFVQSCCQIKENIDDYVRDKLMCDVCKKGLGDECQAKDVLKAKQLINVLLSKSSVDASESKISEQESMLESYNAICKCDDPYINQIPTCPISYQAITALALRIDNYMKERECCTAVCQFDDIYKQMPRSSISSQPITYLPEVIEIDDNIRQSSTSTCQCDDTYTKPVYKTLTLSQSHPIAEDSQIDDYNREFSTSTCQCDDTYTKHVSKTLILSHTIAEDSQFDDYNREFSTSTCQCDDTYTKQVSTTSNSSQTKPIPEYYCNREYSTSTCQCDTYDKQVSIGFISSQTNPKAKNDCNREFSTSTCQCDTHDKQGSRCDISSQTNPIVEDLEINDYNKEFSTSTCQCDDTHDKHVSRCSISCQNAPISELTIKKSSTCSCDDTNDKLISKSSMSHQASTAPETSHAIEFIRELSLSKSAICQCDNTNNSRISKFSDKKQCTLCLANNAPQLTIFNVGIRECSSYKSVICSCDDTNYRLISKSFIPCQANITPQPTQENVGITECTSNKSVTCPCDDVNVKLRTRSSMQYSYCIEPEAAQVEELIEIINVSKSATCQCISHDTRINQKSRSSISCPAGYGVVQIDDVSREFSSSKSANCQCTNDINDTCIKEKPENNKSFQVNTAPLSLQVFNNISERSTSQSVTCQCEDTNNTLVLSRSFSGQANTVPQPIQVSVGMTECTSNKSVICLCDDTQYNLILKSSIPCQASITPQPTQVNVGITECTSNKSVTCPCDDTNVELETRSSMQYNYCIEPEAAQVEDFITEINISKSATCKCIYDTHINQKSRSSNSCPAGYGGLQVDGVTREFSTSKSAKFQCTNVINDICIKEIREISKSYQVFNYISERSTSKSVPCQCEDTNNTLVPSRSFSCQANTVPQPTQGSVSQSVNTERTSNKSVACSSEDTNSKTSATFNHACNVPVESWEIHNQINDYIRECSAAETCSCDYSLNKTTSTTFYKSDTFKEVISKSAGCPGSGAFPYIFDRVGQPPKVDPIDKEPIIGNTVPRANSPQENRVPPDITSYKSLNISSCVRFTEITPAVTTSISLNIILPSEKNAKAISKINEYIREFNANTQICPCIDSDDNLDNQSESTKMFSTIFFKSDTIRKVISKTGPGEKYSYIFKGVGKPPTVEPLVKELEAILCPNRSETRAFKESSCKFDSVGKTPNAEPFVTELISCNAARCANDTCQTGMNQLPNLVAPKYAYIFERVGKFPNVETFVEELPNTIACCDNAFQTEIFPEIEASKSMNIPSCVCQTISFPDIEASKPLNIASSVWQTRYVPEVEASKSLKLETAEPSKQSYKCNEFTTKPESAYCSPYPERTAFEAIQNNIRKLSYIHNSNTCSLLQSCDCPEVEPISGGSSLRQESTSPRAFNTDSSTSEVAPCPCGFVNLRKTFTRDPLEQSNPASYPDAGFDNVGKLPPILEPITTNIANTCCCIPDSKTDSKYSYIFDRVGKPPIEEPLIEKSKTDAEYSYIFDRVGRPISNKSIKEPYAKSRTGEYPYIFDRVDKSPHEESIIKATNDNSACQTGRFPEVSSSKSLNIPCRVCQTETCSQVAESKSMNMKSITIPLKTSAEPGNRQGSFNFQEIMTITRRTNDDGTVVEKKEFVTIRKEKPKPESDKMQEENKLISTSSCCKSQQISESNRTQSQYSNGSTISCPTLTDATVNTGSYGTASQKTSPICLSGKGVCPNSTEETIIIETMPSKDPEYETRKPCNSATCLTKHVKIPDPATHSCETELKPTTRTIGLQTGCSQVSIEESNSNPESNEACLSCEDRVEGKKIIIKIISEPQVRMTRSSALRKKYCADKNGLSTIPPLYESIKIILPPAYGKDTASDNRGICSLRSKSYCDHGKSKNQELNTSFQVDPLSKSLSCKHCHVTSAVKSIDQVSSYQTCVSNVIGNSEKSIASHELETAELNSLSDSCYEGKLYPCDERYKRRYLNTSVSGTAPSRFKCCRGAGTSSKNGSKERMRDATSETRRSDRYDVRTLSQLTPHPSCKKITPHPSSKKITPHLSCKEVGFKCPCVSEPNFTKKRTRRTLRRCQSCYEGDRYWC